MGSNPTSTAIVPARTSRSGGTPALVGPRSRRPGDRVAGSIGRVDIGALLADVRGIVHHGGAGTAVDALFAGVPEVIVPATQEMAMNGEAVAAMRAGVVVPVSPAPLQRIELRRGLEVFGLSLVEDLAPRVEVQVRRLLSGAYDAGASQARRDLLEMPGLSSVTGVIERLASGSAARG